MNRTDTQAELQRFRRHVEARPEHDRRRRTVGIAAAATGATAAAAATFTLWSADLGDNDRSDSGPAGDPARRQTAEERVAQGFVDAFTARDADRAASYLAPGAKPWDSWRFISDATRRGAGSTWCSRARS